MDLHQETPKGFLGTHPQPWSYNQQHQDGGSCPSQWASSAPWIKISFFVPQPLQIPVTLQGWLWGQHLTPTPDGILVPWSELWDPEGPWLRLQHTDPSCDLSNTKPLWERRGAPNTQTNPGNSTAPAPPGLPCHGLLTMEMLWEQPQVGSESSSALLPRLGLVLSWVARVRNSVRLPATSVTQDVQGQGKMCYPASMEKEKRT